MTVETNRTSIRTFLNCKQPTCSELFSPVTQSDECCAGDFQISNGAGIALVSLSYSASGGIVTGVTTGQCQPTNAANATLTFDPACTASQPTSIRFTAKATNSTGNVCVTWTAVFKQGNQTFTCTKQTCIKCDRMPVNCGDGFSVTPHLFQQMNTDWRRFKFNNVKLPASPIASVDITFMNESAPHHIGGGLVVDGQARSWTNPTSGGPADPYTQIRLGCDTAATHGNAANVSLGFNLGVDNTTSPQYQGLVRVKLTYCDGDTCVNLYKWEPRRMNGKPGSVTELATPEDLRIFTVGLRPVDSTTSVTITLSDSASTVIAATASSPEPRADTTNWFAHQAIAQGPTISYIPVGDKVEEIDYCELSVVFKPGTVVTSGKYPITVRYFNIHGQEIAQTEVEVSATRVVSRVPNVTQPGPGIQIESVSPNPGSGMLTVRCSLKKNEEFRLELLDLQGRMITLLESGQRDTNPFEVSYDVTSLASGTYILRLTTSTDVVTSPLRVVH